MIYARVFLISVLFLVACEQTGGNINRGVGTDLYSMRTSQATSNLINYLNAMCAQAGIVQEGEKTKNGDKTYVCRDGMEAEEYQLIMQTGFNDIDARCDKYLAAISRQRLEARAFTRQSAAGLGFARAVFRIAGNTSDTLAYLTEALNLTNLLLDEENLSLLAAIDTSTIMTLVNKNRRAFRKVATETKVQDRPQAIYALRNYLAICTPQSIVLNVNNFSVAAINGTKVSFDESIKAQFAAIQPLDVDDEALGKTNVVVPDPTKCPGCVKFFAEPTQFENFDLQKYQRRLCVKADSLVGSKTRMAIKIFEQHLFRGEGAKDGEKRDDLISLVETARLDKFGCMSAGDRGIYRNYFESFKFKGDSRKPSRNSLISALNSIDGGDPIPFSEEKGSDGKLKSVVGMDNIALRAKIGLAIQVNKADLSLIPPSNQMTWELLKLIQKE